MPRLSRLFGSKKFAWLLVSLGVIGLAMSGVLLSTSRVTAPKIPKDVNLAQAPTAVKPSPKVVSTYNVPADNPKYISIPAIGINQARVIRLGLLKNGDIATPDNIYDTGWYDASAKPGQDGSMFIYGHVSSWQANGIFYNLKKLKSGDKVTITRGDNQIFTYQVVSSKIYPYNAVDMNAVLAPVDPSEPGLNLMTCTGQVIKGTSEFDQRLVVFTSLVSS